MKRRVGLILFFLMILGAGLRLLHFRAVSAHPALTIYFPGTDSFRFDYWGQRIADGDLLAGRQSYAQSPLYYYFLALVFRIFGHDFSPVFLVQHLLGLLSGLLLFRVVRGWFTVPVALCATGIYFAAPVPVFYEAALLRETLVLFLLVTVVHQLEYAQHSERTGGWPVAWPVAGWLLGMLILARPNYLLFAMALPFWMPRRSPRRFTGRSPCRFTGRSPCRLTCRPAAGLLLLSGLLLALLPLFVRNLAVRVPAWSLSTQAARVLILGHHPEMRGEGMTESPVYRSLIETSGDRVGVAFPLVLREVIRHPSGWFLLQYRKVRSLFRAYEEPNNLNFYLVRRFSMALRVPLTVLIFVFFWPGLIHAWRRRGKCGLLFLVLICQFLSTLATYHLGRFRLPFYPFLITFSAVGVFAYGQSLVDRNRRMLVFLLLLLLPGILLARYPREPVRAIDELNLGRAYLQLSKPEQALESFNRGLISAPELGILHTQRGIALEQIGRPGEASAEYLLALQCAVPDREAAVRFEQLRVRAGSR